MVLVIAQITVSVILVGLILLQERSSGGGGLFGGGGGGEFYQSRRGMEKGMFVGTIVIAAVFAGLALLNLVIQSP